MDAGTLLTRKGAYDKANAFMWNAPVQDGLRGLYFPQDSRDRAAWDWSDNGGIASVIGDPTVDPVGGHFMSCDLGKGIQTNILEPRALTILAVCRTGADGLSNTTRPCLVGNPAIGARSQINPALPSPGVQLYLSAPGVITLSAHRYAVGDPTNDSSTGASLAGQPVANWNFYAARMDEARVSVWNMTTTAAEPSPVVPVRQVRDPSDRMIRIGCSVAGVNDGPSDIAAVAIYDRYASADECRKMKAALARYLQLFRGIIV